MRFAGKALSIAFLGTLPLETLWYEDSWNYFVPLKNRTTAEVLTSPRALESDNQPTPKRQPVDIQTIPFAKIHQAILENKNNQRLAAAQLGVGSEALLIHLVHFSYQLEPLSFEILAQLSTETLKTHYKEDYDKPLICANPINPKDYSLKEIHKNLLKAPSARQATIKMGIPYVQLERNLKKLRYHNEPLTIQLLRTTSVKDIQSQFIETYDIPLAEVQAYLKQTLIGKRKLPEYEQIMTLDNRQKKRPDFLFFSSNNPTNANEQSRTAQAPPAPSITLE